MYKSEKKYIPVMISAVSSIGLDTKDLAKERISNFSGLMYKLLVEEKEEFDLLVSGGNSGLYMTQITGQIYKKLDLVSPKTIVLPIVRYKGDEKVGFAGGGERFDNSYLAPNLKKDLEGLEVKNVLFVDDEIRIAWTAKTIFEMLEKCLNKELTCTIVAENHLFEWQHTIPNVAIRYFSPAAFIPGINNIFTYLIEPKLYDFLTQKFTYLNNRNKILAAVLCGQYKTIIGDRAEFVDFNDEIEIREELVSEIDQLIEVGIADYKAGLITFKA